MTFDPCREMRPLLGAAALGGLDPGEEIALRAHLDGCAECRAELRELSSVARALPLADPARLLERAEPSGGLGDQVLERVSRERAIARGRRNRYALIGTAAAIVVAAAVIALIAFVPRGAHGERVDFSAAPGVSAHATLRSRAAGTEVAFHVQGLHDGDYYWLWLTGDDGDRIAAGTFRGTPNPSTLVMTAAIPLPEARRIWVTDAHNHVVLDHILPAASTS